MKNIPTIVIVAYNRPLSLKRLLESISKANFTKFDDIRLIISIDRSNSLEVENVANEFKWDHGQKKVIHHNKRLGLKKHVLACGDLSLKYDAIIVLEDDLVVSPEFYNYTLSALTFYEKDHDICGISLNNPDVNEFADLNFIPIEDGFDSYFIKTTSSRGQVWTSNQWLEFRTWYKINCDKALSLDNLPEKILKWPESSWKKYFNKYQADSNKYFVYPRVSLTTNFGDAGTHYNYVGSLLQVNLLLKNKNWNFSRLKHSIAVYDCYFEPCSSKLKQYINLNLNGNLECDFYGIKPLNKINSKYILSSKRCSNPIKSFDNAMKPALLNCIYDIPGNKIHLGLKNNFANFSKAIFYQYAYNQSPFQNWRIFLRIGFYFLFKTIKDKLTK